MEGYILFISVTTILFLLSVISYFKFKRLEIICTAETKGEVVKFSKIRNQDRGGYMYSPIFKYTVNGIDYKADGNTYVSSPSVYEGEKVTIKYNPNNPIQCYSPDFPEAKEGRIILLILAVGFFVLTMYVLFLRK